MNQAPHPHLLHASLITPSLPAFDKAAFIHDDREIRYGDLAANARRGASWLAGQGCRPGDRVAIALPKGLAAVQLVFAALAAGLVVVPLDMAAPAARFAGILDDAAPRLLVTSPALHGRLVAAGYGGRGACAIWTERDDFPPALESDPLDSLPPIGPEHPALLLYTSGTTGAPKAICLSHANVASFTRWAIGTFRIGSADRFAGHAPLHFDLSTLDLFAAVAAGASTLLLDEIAVRFPAKVAQLLEANGVTVWYSVPTALVYLLQHGALERRDLARLRLVLFAGEPFPVPMLRQLMLALPGREFANLYGPTETNVCTYYRVPEPPAADAAAIPIGSPCEHLRVELFRDDGSPADEGEIGEVTVFGPAVMSGYWNKPALTAAVRHVGDPSSYRTGDFAVRDAAGRLHLVGRRDDQVKVSGHRVELLEVATVLNRYPPVLEAAVILADDRPRLVAFAAARQGETVAAEAIDRHCRNWLPAYAVPAEIRLLDRLPRTSTGKIDKQALRRAIAQPPMSGETHEPDPARPGPFRNPSLDPEPQQESRRPGLGGNGPDQ